MDRIYSQFKNSKALSSYRSLIQISDSFACRCLAQRTEALSSYGHNDHMFRHLSFNLTLKKSSVTVPEHELVRLKRAN